MFIQALLGQLLGAWEDQSVPTAFYQAGLLLLFSDIAQQQLVLNSRWNFETTLKRTVNWYQVVHNCASPLESYRADLQAYDTAPHGPQPHPYSRSVRASGPSL